MIPCESYVDPKQLTLHKRQGLRGASILGMTAALGAATGLLLYGARGALLAAFGTAYVATRDDSAGHLFRSIGSTSADAVDVHSKRAITKLRCIDLGKCKYRVLIPVGETTFQARKVISDIVSESLRSIKSVGPLLTQALELAKSSGSAGSSEDDAPSDAPLFLGSAAKKF